MAAPAALLAVAKHGSGTLNKAMRYLLDSDAVPDRCCGSYLAARRASPRMGGPSNRRSCTLVNSAAQRASNKGSPRIVALVVFLCGVALVVFLCGVLIRRRSLVTTQQHRARFQCAEHPSVAFAARTTRPRRRLAAGVLRGLHLPRVVDLPFPTS